MSLESIRVSVATAVEGVRAGFNLGYPLVVEYDNITIVDTRTQLDPFLTVNVKLLSGEQKDLSDHPTHRIHGQIVIAAAVPEMTGSSKALKLLDFFYPSLQRKKLGNITTWAVTPAPVHPHLGWEYYSILIPFWSDQVM